MDIVDSTVAGSVINAKDTLDLNNQVIKLFKETPFMVVPAGFTGKVEKVADDVYSKVQDKLNVKVESFVPNIDDLETMTVSLIGVLPVVGPAMQGCFTLLTSKLKGTQRQEVITKETIKNMVDIEMAKVKKELIGTIKEKVEKSSVDQKVKLAEKGFEGLKESHMDLLFESLTHLKVRLLNKQIPEKNDALLTGIRSKFDSLRTNIKLLLNVVSDQVILQNSPNLSVEVMVLYILVLNDLIYHWYQYSFDPQYAIGTPADDEEPATHSYREKLHLNIQRFLKQVEQATLDYYNAQGEVDKLFEIEYDFDEQEEIKKRREKENALDKYHIQDIKNVDKVFESDPIYYPIPLVKVTEGFYTPEQSPFKSIKINTSQKKGPCIYRIDGNKFNSIDQPQILKSDSSYKDLATGCYGKYVTREAHTLGIELDKAKSISIRFLCLLNNKYKQNVNYAFKFSNDAVFKTIEKYDQVFGAYTLDDGHFNYHHESGSSLNEFRLFTSEIIELKNNSFELEVYVNAAQYAKFIFCELIINN